MRLVLLIATALSLVGFDPRGAAGQSADEEVAQTVNRLFDAMRTGDGAAAAALFHERARLQSVVAAPDGARLVTGDPAEFVRAIGTPRSEVWDERISDLRIEVDGGLATAWMRYSFHLDGTFSHCGVNAFQLVNEGGGWRILQVTDTRRQTAC